MNNEYIIVNKSFIDKRIEELVKELAYHEEWYKKARDNYHNDKKNWGQADDGEMRAASDAASTTAHEIKILKEILSQSTPLIPELQKTWNAAYIDAMSIDEETYEPLFFQDYITNLKLDI